MTALSADKFLVSRNAANVMRTLLIGSQQPETAALLPGAEVAPERGGCGGGASAGGRRRGLRQARGRRKRPPPHLLRRVRPPPCSLQASVRVAMGVPRGCEGCCGKQQAALGHHCRSSHLIFCIVDMSSSSFRLVVQRMTRCASACSGTSKPEFIWRAHDDVSGMLRQACSTRWTASRRRRAACCS